MQHFITISEYALDKILPMVYLAIRRGRYAAVALGRDGRLDARCGSLGTDGIGNIAFVGGQRLDAAGRHPEQRAKALNVVRLLWR